MYCMPQKSSTSTRSEKASKVKNYLPNDTLVAAKALKILDKSKDNNLFRQIETEASMTVWAIFWIWLFDRSLDYFTFFTRSQYRYSQNDPKHFKYQSRNCRRINFRQLSNGTLNPMSLKVLIPLLWCLKWSPFCLIPIFDRFWLFFHLYYHIYNNTS